MCVRGGHERVVHREKAALLDSPAVLFVRQPSCPGASTAATLRRSRRQPRSVTGVGDPASGRKDHDLKGDADVVTSYEAGPDVEAAVAIDPRGGADRDAIETHLTRGV